MYKIGAAQRKRNGKENWINKGLNLRTHNVVFCLFGFAEVIFSFPLVLSVDDAITFLTLRFLIPALFFVQHHLGIHLSLLEMFCFVLFELSPRGSSHSEKEKLQNKRCSHKTNLFDEGEEGIWVMRWKAEQIFCVNLEVIWLNNFSCRVKYLKWNFLSNLKR